jgi:hypothetical protein
MSQTFKTATNFSQILKKADIYIYTVLLFLITFPQTAFFFNTDFDPSCYWAYNYLFAHDYQALTSLIYTYGPLGFLRGTYPVGNNIIIALLFHTITRLLFIFYGLLFAERYGKMSKPASVAVVGLLAFFSGVDMIIFGLVYLFVVTIKKTQRVSYIYIAVCFAYLGLTIKSSIGILSFSVIGIHVIRDILINKNFRLLLHAVIAALAGGIVFGFVLTGNPWKLILLVKNYIMLSASYTHGLTYHNDNNYLLLTLMFAVIFSGLYFIRSKEFGYHFLMLSFAMFASWKHAMVRQDVSHTFTFFQFMVFFYSTAFVFVHAGRRRLIVIGTTVLLLFYSNMYQTENFRGKYMEIAGIQNFTTAAFNHRLLYEELHQRSMKEISSRILSEDLRKFIGNREIDIFPSDLSYVSANNLNWRPRPTFQSLPLGAWYDNQSAQHFTSESGIDLVLFHYFFAERASKADYIDNQLLYNVEPMTCFSLFNHYDIKERNNQFLLLEHSGSRKFSDFEHFETQTLTWDTWIDVPYAGDGILFAEFSYSRSLAGRLKTMLFRDEYYFISYAFADGATVTYRFTPSIAQNGLWINPLPREIHTSFTEPLVEKIRFSTTDNKMVRPEIILQWKLAKPVVSAEQENAYTQGFMAFGKYNFETSEQTEFTWTLNEGFTEEISFWDIRKEDRDRMAECAGKPAIFVLPGGYSPALVLPGNKLLEIFKSNDMNFRIIAVVEQTEGEMSDFVISLENDNTSLYWKAYPFEGTNTFRIHHNMKETVLQDYVLKFYVWNTGNNPLKVCTLQITAYEDQESGFTSP